jgi:CRISPR system Cascade subunit CasB
MQPDNDKRPKLIQDWWSDLQRDPGARAKLRRCRKPIEALALPATIDLMLRMSWKPPESDRYDWYGERIAAIAMVLAHVREDIEQPVVRPLGATRGFEKPLLSQSRWERLSNVEGSEDIAIEFTRLVQMLGGTANVVDLALTMLTWDHETNHRAKQRWIYTYYGADLLAQEVSTTSTSTPDSQIQSISPGVP